MLLCKTDLLQAGEVTAATRWANGGMETGSFKRLCQAFYASQQPRGDGSQATLNNSFRMNSPGLSSGQSCTASLTLYPWGTQTCPEPLRSDVPLSLHKNSISNTPSPPQQALGGKFRSGNTLGPVLKASTHGAL